MATYNEILAVLNNLNDTEFYKFTTNFKEFRFKRRIQYALFLSARKSYDKITCNILGLKTEAEKQQEENEKHYDRVAHKIMGVELEDETSKSGKKRESIEVEDLRWRKVLILRRPLIIYGIIIAIILFFFLW